MGKGQSNKEALVTGIKIGVPVVAIGVGVLLFRKAVKKKRNADGTSKRTAPSIQNMAIETSKLTISPTDAALYANTLYGAMQNWGTDERTIFNTINKVRSKDDMLLIIKAFGMKKYLLGSRAAFLGQGFNLIGWLRQELGRKEIAKIKPKFDSWGIPL